MSETSGAGSTVTLHMDPTRCSKCDEPWSLGYGNMREEHDTILCESRVFRTKHHSYGMVSIEPTIKKVAVERGQAPWLVVQDIERALVKVYPRLAYKLFYRASGLVWGAYVESWGAVALQAYFDQGGYADLTLADFLEKVADERHPAR